MKLTNRILVWVLVTTLLLTTWGCKGDSEKPIPDVPIKAIQVAPDNLTMTVGDFRQVKAEPGPADADSREIPFIWKSSNSDIASVSSEGLVTAVSAGYTEITVGARITTEISKKIPVTVADVSIPLTGISVIPNNLMLQVDKSVQVVAEPQPENATGVSFTWESDDTNIAAVNETGLVTGIAEGSTTVSVKSGNIEQRVSIIVVPPPRIEIDGTFYTIDTLHYEEVAQGITWFNFSIPEFRNGFGSFGKGLIVNSVGVDLSYPENKLEVWPAALRARDNRETPSAAYKRKELEYASVGHRPVVSINGDFYLLDANNETGYAYINRRPLGMEIDNGKVIQTPLSISYRAGLAIRDNGFPEYVIRAAFFGAVDAGGYNYTLSEVNGFTDEGGLVLFNNQANSYTTDSAFAWSPYTSTLVSLSYPEGGWRVNDRMEFTVTNIERDVEGKNFNGEGAILVGNPTSSTLNNGSKQFLSRLKIGDKVGIRMDITFNEKSIPDKKISMTGFRGIILRRGEEVTNTWNEAHPRTAIGYSEDNSKAYLIVIDGRQNNYSAGATTGQVAYILKALGAYAAVNLDGGGSSAMVVDGNVVNKPSDGSERVVANGFMITTTK